MSAVLLHPYFHQEGAAHSKLERILWPHSPVCPHCGARDRIGSVTGKGARIALKFCCQCRKQFRATIGTLFEGSHIPLNKWFQASFLRHCCYQRINSHQLHLALEITYKSSLWMVRKLDKSVEKNGQDLGSISEIDMRGNQRENSRGPIIRSRRPFGGVLAEVAFAEDEVPWVMPSSTAPQRQCAIFVEVALGLRPIEDEGLFDRVLAQMTCGPEGSGQGHDNHRMDEPHVKPVVGLQQDRT
jgi:hypothetical protein